MTNMQEFLRELKSNLEADIDDTGHSEPFAKKDAQFITEIFTETLQRYTERK